MMTIIIVFGDLGRLKCSLPAMLYSAKKMGTSQQQIGGKLK